MVRCLGLSLFRISMSWYRLSLDDLPHNYCSSDNYRQVTKPSQLPDKNDHSTQNEMPHEKVSSQFFPLLFCISIGKFSSDLVQRTIIDSALVSWSDLSVAFVVCSVLFSVVFCLCRIFVELLSSDLEQLTISDSVLLFYFFFFICKIQ